MDRAAQRGMTAGLTGRILAAWRGPEAAFRVEAAESPSEARILAWCFAAALFIMLGLVGGRYIEQEGMAVGTAVGILVVGMFFTPLFLYGVAALLGMICRARGGVGDWRETRLALFWAMAVAGPAVALIRVLGSLIGSGAAALAAGNLALVIFLAPALAVAHGFDKGKTFGILVFVAFVAVSTRLVQ